MTLTEWNEVDQVFATDLRPQSEVRIDLPPVEVIARRWNEIEPLLARSTCRTNCYEPIDVLVMSTAGRAAIWLCTKADKILAVLVCQVVNYPRKRVLEMMFAGGDSMSEWRDLAVQTMDEYARSLGCSHIACAGRRAWARAWGGYPTGDVIMVREI